MHLANTHIEAHTKWPQLESNHGYRRLRTAMIQGCRVLLRGPHQVGGRRDSRSPLQWYSRGRGARRGGSMMLVDARSHHSLRCRLAVFHLWWSWTRVLPLSVAIRRVQIFPGGICPVSAGSSATSQVQRTTVGVLKSSCMPRPALTVVLPVSIMSIDESRKLLMADGHICWHVVDALGTNER